MIINTRGPFLCYKYAAEQMIKQGRGGRIIGASSHAAKQALPLNGLYSASKCAVKGLTQSVGKDHFTSPLTIISDRVSVGTWPIRHHCEFVRPRLHQLADE